MASSANSTDLGVTALMRGVQEEVRFAPKPLVRQVNLATGTGKTFQALMASAEALLKAAQESGESLIIVYIAPQHRHIDLQNMPVPASLHPAQAKLEQAGIPVARANTQTQLTSLDNPLNLQARLTTLTSEGITQSTLKGLVETLDDALERKARKSDTTDPSLESVSDLLDQQDATPVDSIRALLKDIAGLIKQVRQQKLNIMNWGDDADDADALGDVQPSSDISALERERQKEVLANLEDHLKKVFEKLFYHVRSAVEWVLQESALKDDGSLENPVALIIGQQDVRRAFHGLVREFHPFYDIVRRRGGPLGMVAMTTAKLMTTQRFPKEHANKPGGVVFDSFMLEDAIHGGGKHGDRIHGLSANRTRFLLFIEESDRAKSIIDEPNPTESAHNRFRTYLRGPILSDKRITQVAGTLLNEMPVLLQPKEDHDALMACYEAIAKQDEAFAKHLKSHDYHALRLRKTWKPETARQLAECRRRLDLDDDDPAIHYQQSLLRQRLKTTLIEQAKQKQAAEGTPSDSADIDGECLLNDFRERLTRIAQGVSYINLLLSDPAVIAAGSGGSFTGGSWAFLNLSEPHLRELRVSRARGGTSHTIRIQGPLEYRGNPQADTSDRLCDLCEMLLTLVSIGDEMQSKGDFSILRHLYRAGNMTHSSPLTVLLKSLENTSIKRVIGRRHHVDPDQPIDMDTAYRTPHLVFQWAPDIEERYGPRSECVSVVPMVHFRLWSAEHHIERLVSKEAYLRGLDLEEQRNDQEQATFNRVQALKRPLHSAVLISATGGLPGTHFGGFSIPFMESSSYIEYRPMGSDDYRHARHAREERLQSGRHGAKVSCLARNTSVIPRGISLPGRDEIASTINYITQNPHKIKEATRFAEAVMALSAPPYELERINAMAGISASNPAALALAQLAMGDPPVMGLSLMQSPENLRNAFRHLARTNAVVEIITGHLYGYYGDRSTGGRPTLVMFYNSGSQNGTDHRIGNLLAMATEAQHVKHGDGPVAKLQRFIATATGDPDISLASLFPKEKDGTPQQYEATDLLRTDLGCHVMVGTAYLSAGVGVNFKVNRHLGRGTGERDIDLHMLVVSPYYSKAKPQYKRYASLPDNLKGEAYDKIVQSNVINRQNNNKAALFEAFAGIEMAAHENTFEAPERPYLIRDIRLHPDSWLKEYQGYRYQQHLTCLVADILQAIGRGERTQAAQLQTLIVCEEVEEILQKADPLLFGESRFPEGENPLDAISLNGWSLVQFVRDRLRQHFQFPEPSETKACKKRQKAIIELFTESDTTSGWKNAQLAQNRRVNERSLSHEDALQQIALWEAWRSPALLFESTREGYMGQIEVAGVEEEVRDAMWWPLTQGKKLLFDKRGANRYVLLSPDDRQEMPNARAYPENAIMGASLPTSFTHLTIAQHDAPWLSGALQAMCDGYGPSVHWTSKERVLHPQLKHDAQGIWGELAGDLWVAYLHQQHGHALFQHLVPMEGAETMGVFELFDRFYSLTHANGERVLLALDAKHNAVPTDRRRGVEPFSERHDRNKRHTVSRWAKAKGFDRTIMLYLNTRPGTQEMTQAQAARPDVQFDQKEASSVLPTNLLAVYGFLQIAPTDANAPPDVRFDDEREGFSPLVTVNQFAVEKLLAVL